MNRREVLKNAVLGTVALSLPSSFVQSALGGALPEAAQSSKTLRIVRRSIEVKGRKANVFGLIQADGKHGLSLPSDGDFDVVLRNETAEPTIIHWHGLTRRGTRMAFRTHRSGSSRRRRADRSAFRLALPARIGCTRTRCKSRACSQRR